jgi:hypothetical protein
LNPAPIALFVYNRLIHTEKTINALLQNKEAANTDLYIFSDGAKNISEEQKVNDLRSYLKTIVGFKSITIKEQLINKGLANSIIDGVTDLIELAGKIIVLEDDILVSPQFLSYMNNGLNKYENELNVASIHAYVYPINDILPNMFFLKGADCWGWATWKRAWKNFEPNGIILKEKLIQQKLVSSFNYDETYPFFTMLENQIIGKNNSWAIRWHASCYLNNMLTLYPGKTLITNIGFDNSGTHCGTDDIYNSDIQKIDLDSFPNKIIESTIARVAFKNFFTSSKPQMNNSIMFRIKNKIKKLLG